MTEYFLKPDSPEITNNCIAFIRSELSSDKPLRVVITEKEQSRSQAQRQLQWSWYTQWANFSGDDKQVIRNRLMYRFGIPIFYRDNIVINGIYSADTIDVIRDLKAKGLNMQYQQLIMQFVANISSNSFTVKQNTEYLESVFNFANEQGVSLFVPGDLSNAKFKA